MLIQSDLHQIQQQDLLQTQSLLTPQAENVEEVKQIKNDGGKQTAVCQKAADDRLERPLNICHFVFNSFTFYKYELSFFLLSEFDAETRTSWCVEVHLVKL